MSQSPALKFLLSKAPGEVGPDMSSAELLKTLASLELSEDDKVLGIIFAVELIEGCLQEDPTSTSLPGIDSLVSLAKELLSCGHFRLVQSFCTAIAQLVRFKLVNNLSADTLLHIANLLSSFAGRLTSNEYLDLLSIYLNSADKAIFMIGVQIVDKSRGIEQVMLSPVHTSDYELASLVSAGSFLHQVDLSSYFSALSKLALIFPHIDRLVLCYKLYEKLLRTTYLHIINKSSTTDSGFISATAAITAEAHARNTLDALSPYLFQPTLSTVQLEFLTDVMGLATQHSQSPLISNCLADLVAELHGFAKLYDDSAFLARVTALQKVTHDATLPSSSSLLFVEHMRRACAQRGGLFNTILMRLAVCIYKLEILLCKRNKSVKYNSVMQTELTAHINGKPITECTELLEAARSTDAPEELKLYVNMRHLQKSILRKS